MHIILIQNFKLLRVYIRWLWLT